MFPVSIVVGAKRTRYCMLPPGVTGPKGVKCWFGKASRPDLKMRWLITPFVVPLLVTVTSRSFSSPTQTSPKSTTTGLSARSAFCTVVVKVMSFCFGHSGLP